MLPRILIRWHMLSVITSRRAIVLSLCRAWDGRFCRRWVLFNRFGFWSGNITRWNKYVGGLMTYRVYRAWMPYLHFKIVRHP